MITTAATILWTAAHNVRQRVKLFIRGKFAVISTCLIIKSPSGFLVSTQTTMPFRQFMCYF